MAQEGDERPSVVRRVFSGPKKREKKITQTVLPSATKLDYLVKDAPKKVEAERPNQRSHAQATKLGKAAKILVDKVKQDKDYQPSPKPASEKAKVDHPSFKDKGRAATEQPNNKFKGVSGVHGDISSFAPDKASPSALRGKGEEKEKVLAQEGDKSPSVVRRVPSGPKKKGPPAATVVAGGWGGALEKNKKNRAKLASEKEKVLAQEGDKSPSVDRRVSSGRNKREKKITQTNELCVASTKLVKDAPKEVEAERPNQRSHAQAPNLGKATDIDNVKQDKDSERNHPAKEGDSQPSPKPASGKAKIDPSFKDKGRAATEQPNNIFKGVRRDQWGLSSFAPNKGSRPKSFLRTKYKIFNPLKQLVGEHRESLVPDALKELEPAKHPEILVPDAVKRPVRRQKPASDIFSKSFFHPINSDNRLTSYVYPLEEKLRQPKGGGHIGDRKYFPAASTEWKNTIYVFNRNALYKNLPAE